MEIERGAPTMRIGFLVICLGVMLSSHVEAQTRTSGTFDVFLRGIKGATYSFGALEDGRRYSVTGRFETVGLVAAVRQVSYSAKVQGTIQGNRFVPSRYEDTRNRGGKVSGSRMEYRGGVPVKRVFDPPRPNCKAKVDFATQGDAVDVLTAGHVALRDMPKDQVCRFSSYLFDGTRRAQVVLGKPRTEGDFIVCDAEYRRIEGYSEHQMNNEGRTFAFRVSYGDAGNGLWHAKRIDMNTTYGRGSMVRR